MAHPQLFLWFLLLAISPRVAGQITQECPLGWETWGGQCYMFVFYPIRDYSQAGTACQVDSAHLLSVNTEDEHDFVSQWLTRHDINRNNRWWTSGVGGGDLLRWEGDGTTAVLDQADKWTNDQTLNQQSTLPVAYTFTTQTHSFMWSRQLPAVQSPYVCEISLSQAFRIQQARRDFTFGTNTSDVSVVPRGPSFTIEPESVVVVGVMETVFLECAADANPPASYAWYREESSGDVAVTSQLDARYSITNGRFSFQNPDATRDEGRYYCLASNTFGTIISHTVHVAFGFLGEFSNDPPGSVRALQYQGTYIECRPPNYNPRLDYLWYKGPAANFLRTDLNQYLFMSFNGRLYLSETQASDAGFYHCVVTLVAPLGQKVATGQAPSRASLGIELTIQGDTPTEFGPLIHNDFPAVFPTPALRGITIRLECFAYGRLPLYYKWHRDNGPLPEKAQLLDTDQDRVLLIPDAQLEDSGNYTCRVERGTWATDEKSIALNVEAVPFFPSPLRDQHVDIGTTFTLVCLAMAVPLPTYSWYKNGQPLTSDPDNIEVSENVLTFWNADPERHDGMFECSASNIHGTRMSTAQVRVLEFTPSFSKNALRASQTATVGGNVTILCQPEAAPAPTFTWSHDARALGLTPGGQGRVMLLDNGNLLISPVQLSDQGEYTCTAENSKGSASSSGHLLVATATTLTIAPHDTDVLCNETAFMSCEASYDQRHTDLAYIWTFNGYAIHFEYDPHLKMAQYQGQWGLYVINAQFDHEGYYQCNAVTASGTVAGHGYLTVKGPPSEPAGVFGSTEGNVVILYWSAGGLTHGSPVIYYIIEFSSNFRPDWRVRVAELRVADAFSNLYPDKLTYHVTGLSPGSLYRFRIKAVNQFGISQPSLPSEYLHVPDAAPLVAPGGIRNLISTVGTLAFQWDALNPEDLTGEGRGYKPFWRKKDHNVYSESRWETDHVGAGTTTFVTLVGMENYYVEYEIMVAAFNSMGQGPNSSVTVLMSQEDMPLATCEQVYAERVNSTAVLVHWAPLILRREIMRGRLQGIQVNYWWENDPGRMFGINIYCSTAPLPYDCVKGTIIGLEPNTMYWVNLQVFTTAGLGTMSETFRVSTVLSAPLQYPEYVMVSSMDGPTVLVRWRGIYIGLKEAPLQGYKLWWWPATEQIWTANVTVIPDRMQNWAVLDGVKQGTLYALRVLGYSGGGDGKKSPTVYFTLEGQIVYNPETTEVLAKGSDVTASIWFIMTSCVLCCLFRVVA